MFAPSQLPSKITLALCIVLHAFTHAYGSMLVPLYLLMSADLHLGSVKRAALLVSIYSLVYCIGSYPAGVASDRFNRKLLLGIGLLGNAAAMVLIGLTRNYQLLMLWSVLGGACGTLFHPAAGALVPAHFPKAPGMAVGLLGIGSGIGFFVGPQFAGWRSQAARWSIPGLAVADWQKPCVELGLAGVVAGLLFLLIAGETRADVKHKTDSAERLAPATRDRALLIGLILGCRDFAGVGGLSLAGIYLMRAHGLDAKSTGAVLGLMMLLSVIVNPTLVWFTTGKRRLPALQISLILGGIVAATIPLFPKMLALPVLCAFQTCQLGSYAISDSALLERASAATRGRIYGLFFTVAGIMGSAGPWLMGAWTDSLKARAETPAGYFLPFGVLGLCMMAASMAAPLIYRLGPVKTSVDPLSEIMPVSMEIAG